MYATPRHASDSRGPTRSWRNVRVQGKAEAEAGSKSNALPPFMAGADATGFGGRAEDLAGGASDRSARPHDLHDLSARRRRIVTDDPVVAGIGHPEGAGACRDPARLVESR